MKRTMGRGWQSNGAWTRVGVDLKSCQPRKHGKVLCKGDVEVEKGTSGCWIGKGLKQSKTGGSNASEEAIREASENRQWLWE